MIKESSFPSAAVGEIYVCTWTPEDGHVRGVVQLTHGMAEHSSRYDAFARYLNTHGFVVVAQDHAGHGRSLGEDGIPGYFGKMDGWTHLLADMRTVYETTKAAYPNIPYTLMGHSMGSFLARSYAARFGADMDAFIFSGTAGKNGALPIAKWLARRTIRKRGATAGGEKLDALCFGAYGKAIPNARTPFDWLSRDAGVVDAYIADPLCGFAFTAGGFRDLFDGLSEISAVDWAQKVPAKPILMLSGEEDPVGGKKAAGVRQVAAALRQTGHDVTLHIYPGGRHEMLNEPEKEQVYADILSFLEGIS